MSASDLAVTAGYQALVERQWASGDYRFEGVFHSYHARVEHQCGHDSKSVLLCLGAHSSPSEKHLSGPWVEIALDQKTQQIHISRDPAGLMAAFFARTPNGYIISDSVPAMLAHEAVSRVVDIEALNEYWYLDFCIAPKTIWKDIRSVPNGHRVALPMTTEGEPVYEQFWMPGLAAREALPLSGKEAPAAIREVVLQDTQQITERATHGFVNLLSGGVDSSVVLAACHVLGRQPDHAITFKGIGDADESGLAALTARHLGIPLVVAQADSVDLVEDAYELVRTWAQPYAHGSVHAMQQILQHVPEGRAVLTGDGGGEAFLGNPAPISPWRWIADPAFRSVNALPPGLRRDMYRRLATRSFTARALSYALELKAARNEKERQLRGGPITQWEMEAAISKDMQRYFSKTRIGERLNELALKSDLPGESLYARSLLFWWSSEGVYAKTWRLLDAKGVAGFGPLTSPRFFDTVKRIPMEERGQRKQALRDAFADVLPTEVLNAPKRGLRPLNRELLMEQADSGISWIADGGSDAWDHLFDRDTVAAFWRAHRDGRVYRSNLLYKAIIFRAWCDVWKPVIEEPKV
ncbi:asparagine synthase-related protein [Ectothiorhodospira shaposhnikovii]|uniref:asparagine synthase-related protein n=1 Tax=Ectothiorhodospira shaposhnikovii TaxID=1054 RepID=UPI0039A1E521